MSFRLLAADHNNLTLSILAFCVSLFSLGWNVYRDVILKPRFRVGFAIAKYWLRSRRSERSKVLPPDFELTADFELKVVNLGPGTAVVEAAVIKTRHATLTWQSAHIDKIEIKAGQRTILQIPRDSLLEDTKPLRIGIQDVFGRIHWAPRKNLENAQREYAEAKSASLAAGAKMIPCSSWSVENRSS
jgi:hypothetical protein